MKYIYTAIIAVLVGFGVGWYLHTNHSIITSAVGDTQSSAKIAQIVMNGGSAATTTINSIWASFYNSDTNARIIQDLYYSISGLETNAQINLVFATSTCTGALTTTSTTTTGVNIFSQVSLPTSTLLIYQSSSTPGLSGTAPGNRIWPSGMCLNAIASSTVSTATTTTLTGSGIIGVKYAAGGGSNF